MSRKKPLVSVCIPCHSYTKKEHISSCVNSILEQAYDEFEIRIVSQDEDLYDYLTEKFEDEKSVNTHSMTADSGVSGARNICYQVSEGEIIAYIDADAVARKDWLEEITKSYADNEVSAVGGRACPIWASEKPKYISDNFLWLFGITHSSHPKTGSIVRNTFGCNMTFKKDILEELGGFNENLGKKKSNLQAEESEIGIRMRENLNKGTYYNASAIVDHQVESYQTSIKWITDRAYLQGVSKAIINQKTESNLSTENTFFLSVMGEIKENISKLVSRRDIKNSIYKTIGSLYLVFIVVLGYSVQTIKEKIS